MSNATIKQPFRNRIVGHGESAPDQLLANEKNWRIHPFPQQQALESVLTDVGFVQSVIVNKRSLASWPAGERGVETVVDGHLRVMLAISRGQPTVPVVYVDLTPAEEAEVLATIDPLSSMAVTDAAKLDELLREVSVTGEALQQMIADLAEEAGLVPSDIPDPKQQDEPRLRGEHLVKIYCSGEALAKIRPTLDGWDGDGCEIHIS